MHHEGHTQGGGCPKCVINTRLIAKATTMLSAVATAADEMRTIINSAKGFDGCEHAEQLVANARELVEDIEELVTGGR